MTQNKIIELKAREGYYLTQKEEVEDRIFISAIIGANLNKKDWREATEEEKLAFQKTQEDIPQPEI